MITFRTSLVCVGLIAVGLSAAPIAGSKDQPIVVQDNPKASPAPAKEDKPKESAPKKHRGTFTISKETTYVTGPLDKDGYIDYAAALNERLGKGVTPENNANVLIWKAIGPRPDGKAMPAEFFKLMGVEPPPEKGEYFIDLDKHLKDHFQIKPDTKEAYEIRDQLNRCVQRPWIAKENPELASWLKANEKPLAVVIEATKRSQYYSPSVLPKTGKEPTLLISALRTEACRELAYALAARAMLRVGQGAHESAWQDLMTCHRLGRLIERGPTLIDGIEGRAIDHVAAKADLGFLEGAKPNAKRIESCIRDLQRLPVLSGPADKIDLAARFEFLDSVIMMDRDGLKSIEGLVAKALPKDPNALSRAILANMSLDPALKNANERYDRMAAAYREKNRGLRQKKLDQIDEEIKMLKPNWEKEFEQIEAEIKRLQDAGANPEASVKLLTKAFNRLIGDITFAELAPSVSKLQKGWDRVRQEQDNLVIAFALEWYKRDNGNYPKKLADLAPKYLKEIPADVFSGKPLIYRPSEKGYLLYSVGYYGKDEGGRGLEDDPIGWNISVRMPLPELPPK